MNKTDLAREICARFQSGSGGDEGGPFPLSLCKDFTDLMLSVISEELAREGKVVLSGFGTFSIRGQRARTGINPRTREVLRIPARMVPVFKAGKILKDKVR